MGFARGADLVRPVERALAAGTPAVQLRSKLGNTRRDFALALRLRESTRQAGALFFVNDRLDLALAADADGVHLGDDDLPVGAARRIAPPGFLIGFSAASAAEARQAEADGADYLGFGPVYPTGSKADAGVPRGVAELERVAKAVRIPTVGIGGIDATLAAEVVGAGAAGVAVIRALLGTAYPGAAAAALLAAAGG